LAKAVPEKAKNRKRKVPANSERKATVLWRTTEGSTKVRLPNTVMAVVDRLDEPDMLPGDAGEERTGTTAVTAAMVFSEGVPEEPMLQFTLGDKQP
jgi:hypothetical protein